MTIVGTLLLARRSLTEVALVSSLGFAVAFVLALIRLWVATGRTGNTGATSATAPDPGWPSRRAYASAGRSRYLIGSRLSS